jgi:tetratricopeptide (TPR) repeat protein
MKKLRSGCSRTPWRASLGETSLDVAQTLNNLAKIAHARGSFREAADLCGQAIEIKRRASRGPNNALATSINNRAIMHMKLGMLDDAEAGFQSALEMLRQLVGEQHPDYAQTLNNLGELHRARGDHLSAEPYYRGSLKFLRNNYPDSTNCQIARLNLAELCVAQGRAHEAVELMAEVMASDDRIAPKVFSLTSERQRIAYLTDIRIRDMVHLSLLVRESSSGPSVETGLSLVLKRKGLGAEVLAAQRDHILGGRDPQLQPTLQRLTTLRRQVARATLDGPAADGADAHSTKLAQASVERDPLEVQLAERIPEIAVDLRLRRSGISSVAAATPTNAVLIEFVKVVLRDFNAVAARGERIWGPVRYFAFTLVGGATRQRPDARLGRRGRHRPTDRRISRFHKPPRWPFPSRGGCGGSPACGCIRSSPDRLGRSKGDTDRARRTAEPVAV